MARKKEREREKFSRKFKRETKERKQRGSKDEMEGIRPKIHGRDYMDALSLSSMDKHFYEMAIPIVFL